MSLKDKAAKVDLGGLDGVDPPQRPVASTSPTMREGTVGNESPTSPTSMRRSGVAAITQQIAVHHRIQDLEAELDGYRGMALVVRLDPKRIRQGRWKNRDARSFETQEYFKLRAEIQAAGGNVQPIKVRKAGKDEDGDLYEIVFGRRRTRACLECGLPVNAVIEEMDDRQLFVEMDRENRVREDLSPWEQGVAYKQALDEGLFPSNRRLAEALGADLTLVGKAIKLAELPDAVIAAFPSPLTLQYRWASDLAAAVEKDPSGVAERAAKLSATVPRLPPKAAFLALVSSGTASDASKDSSSRQFMAGDTVGASWTRNAKGAITITVKPGVLHSSAEKQLADLLRRLVASRGPG